MPIFEYRASDAAGKILSGSLTSSSREDALAELDARGYVPVSVVEKESRKAKGSGLGRMLGTLSVKELAIFTRQLATLIRAGVPMMSTLTALSHQTDNEFLSEVISEVQDDVEQGASLSIAMGKHPAFFSELYVNTVMAGEQSGALDEVLDRLALLLEGDAETQANIKSAARYPIMVVLLLIAAFFFLVIFVVPKFTSLFGSRGVALPLPTRIIVGINYVINEYWYIVIRSCLPPFPAAACRRLESWTYSRAVSAIRLSARNSRPWRRAFRAAPACRTSSTKARFSLPW